MNVLKAKKLTLALALTAALLMGVLSPAMAGGMPVVKVTGNEPGGMVQVRIDNLPANTLFAVMMGPAGSGGSGGLVAHFESGAGGTQYFRFEIHATVRLAASIDLRIDNGAGSYAVVTFENIILPRPGSDTTPPPTIPATGGTKTNGVTAIKLLNVQKGGWVKVDLVNFPANTDFTVRIGTVATGGLNGSVVAGVTTGTGKSYPAYFEIPFLYRAEASLVLRVESAGKSYTLTFANVDK